MRSRKNYIITKEEVYRSFRTLTYQYLGFLSGLESDVVVLGGNAQ